jgi:hypothetical protein
VKRLKRLLLIVLSVLVLVVCVGITFTIGWRPILGARSRPVTDRKFAATPARLERGAYLVNAVAACFACHSEPDTTLPGLQPKAGREGGGQFAGTNPTLGDIYIPNITPDKETGIGDWTDDEIARAVREGIRRDGRALFPIMQYRNYRHMSDEDIASIVVYLRSIPPIKNALGRLQAPFPVNRLVLSEQYPKGLGHTAEEIQLVLPDEATTFEKSAFSSCGAVGLLDLLRGKGVSQWLYAASKRISA